MQSLLAAAAGVLICLTYRWLAQALGNATIPIPLIALTLVLAASLARPGIRSPGSSDG